MNVSEKDKKTLEDLGVDPRLTFDERYAIKALLQQLQFMTSEQAWRNPYVEAIALLEKAARSHEGGYG